MNFRFPRTWFALALLLSGTRCGGGYDRVDASGCGSGVTIDFTGDGGVRGPTGPVAHDANEAWPKRPAYAPAVGVQDIANACEAWVACKVSDGGTVGGRNDGGGAIDRGGSDGEVDGGVDDADAGAFDVDAFFVGVCIGQIKWSAERAIPIEDLWSAGSLNERAEFFVPCLLEHAGDCAQLAMCASERGTGIYCQEDGCSMSSIGINYALTCNGEIAHFGAGAYSFDRDCSRALAECDPTSPTGCTDRQLTACPPDVTTADRCDGDVRLGCDRRGQVSYRDCARMSGKCGTTDHGFDCIY